MRSTDKQGFNKLKGTLESPGRAMRDLGSFLRVLCRGRSTAVTLTRGYRGEREESDYPD